MAGEVRLADGAERRGELQLGAGLGGGGGRWWSHGGGGKCQGNPGENPGKIHANIGKIHANIGKMHAKSGNIIQNPSKNPCKIREIPRKLEGTC